MRFYLTCKWFLKDHGFRHFDLNGISVRASIPIGENKTRTYTEREIKLGSRMIKSENVSSHACLNINSNKVDISCIMIN